MKLVVRLFFVLSFVILALPLILGIGQLLSAGHPRPAPADTPPAVRIRAAGSPQMLRFPNLVTPRKLTRVAHPIAGPAFALRFARQPITNAQLIRLPAAGSFRLTVQAGPRFAIADADARDGTATVTLPRDVYQVYLRQDGPQPGGLGLSDPLYAVHDSLQQQAWYTLGPRSLPVPASWYSGARQVFELKPQGGSAIEMRWVRTPGLRVDFPPGMAEIGPAGGVVELPNVARLEIPADALPQKTVVRMSQVLEAPSLELQCSGPLGFETCAPGETFVSPIVQIQPMGLELRKPANLEIKLFQEAYTRLPFDIGPQGSSDLSVRSWSHTLYTALSPSIHSYKDLTYDMGIPVKVFAYIAKHGLGSRILAPAEAFRYPDRDPAENRYASDL